MDKIKSIFSELERTYLIKSYIFSTIIAILFLVSNDNSNLMGMTVSFLVIISAILFPFSAFVWDSITSIMMGNNFIFLPFIIMIIWKGTKILMLFYLAIFIAPIGVIYLLIRRKNTLRS